MGRSRVNAPNLDRQDYRKEEQDYRICRINRIQNNCFNPVYPANPVILLKPLVAIGGDCDSWV
jgi:hypothetical protein